MAIVDNGRQFWLVGSVTPERTNDVLAANSPPSTEPDYKDASSVDRASLPFLVDIACHTFKSMLLGITFPDPSIMTTVTPVVW